MMSPRRGIAARVGQAMVNTDARRFEPGREEGLAACSWWRCGRVELHLKRGTELLLAAWLEHSSDCSGNPIVGMANHGGEGHHH